MHAVLRITIFAACHCGIGLQFLWHAFVFCEKIFMVTVQYHYWMICLNDVFFVSELDTYKTHLNSVCLKCVNFILI